MKKLRTVSPAPSDEQLAAAERAEMARRQSRLDEIADQQEQERLAAAGDPEAQAALRATASVLSGRSVGDEDVESDGSDHRKSGRKGNNRTRTRRPPPVHKTRVAKDSGPVSPPAEELGIADAYRLMDLCYKKWAKTADRDVRKANRDLAIDLGKDTALYLRLGIIRLGDLQDVIQKLLAAKAAKEGGEPDSGGIEDDMESLRSTLRGEG